MKILGVHGGHDSAYAVLEDGLPIVHNELERFNRQKGCKGDSLKLALEIENNLDFDYIETKFVLTMFHTIKSLFDNSYNCK